MNPLRALRPVANGDKLGPLLCPPYDVIDSRRREELLATDPDNIVAVVLPEPTPDGYAEAAQLLLHRVDHGVMAVDPEPALFVYEMREADGHVTRGMLGAVELRDPADGVILPHENTMAGPVADRLAVMTATGADLEPIYLVYDGGGPTSTLVAASDDREPVAETTTPDGVRHRLWAISDRDDIAAVAADLATRHALIADGHHRYATYLERQRERRAQNGPGPWDRGLALLVDTLEYGPQVHAIHRVVRDLALADAVARIGGWVDVRSVADVDAGLAELAGLPAASGFAAVLTDGADTYLIEDTGRLAEASRRADEPPALSSLDVTVLHRGLVEAAWGLVDDVATVDYAHDVGTAVRAAAERSGVAVLLRPTPVDGVAGVATAGARMPRKSTLFTPKPASGLVLRRLQDQ